MILNYQIAPITLITKKQKFTVIKIEAMSPAGRLTNYHRTIRCKPKKKIHWKDLSRATFKANYAANSYYPILVKILAAIGAAWALWLFVRCFFSDILPFIPS